MLIKDYISPIAVGGNRFGAWLIKIYPENWNIILNTGNNFELIFNDTEEPKAIAAWNMVNNALQRRQGSLL